SQDVFPEIAVELKRLENPAVIEVLRRAIGAYLERADRVVAIGETMRERLESKGAPPDRLRVIPNWVDSTVLTPQPRDNEWARPGSLRLRGAEPPVRDHGRRAARDRRRGRDERDRPARRAGRVRGRAAARAPGARRGGDSARVRRRARARGDGSPRTRVRDC